MLKEFKAFVMRGNVLDMAVGVIIGGAFGKIVTSMVNDILMPPLGLLVSKVNFANICLDLQSFRLTTLDQAKAAGQATMNIGLFVNTVVDFVIQAFFIFLCVQLVQRLRFREEKKAVVPLPTTKICPFCCSTIALHAVRCPQCTSELAARA